MNFIKLFKIIIELSSDLLILIVTNSTNQHTPLINIILSILIISYLSSLQPFSFFKIYSLGTLHNLLFLFHDDLNLILRKTLTTVMPHRLFYDRYNCNLMNELKIRLMELGSLGIRIVTYQTTKIVIMWIGIFFNQAQTQSN